MKRALLLAAVAFFMAGLFSLPLFMIPIGMNDSEYGTIEETGKIRDHDKFVWSDWSRGYRQIQTFENYEMELGPWTEFRKGVLKGIVFDFTIYECRDARAPGKIEPATGPDYGGAYHWGWTPLLFGIAGVLLVVRLRIRAA